MRLFRAHLWFVAGKTTAGVGNLQEESGLLYCKQALLWSEERMTPQPVWGCLILAEGSAVTTGE